MTRPLSNLNLALSRATASGGGAAAPFVAESVGDLRLWYDPSDSGARAIETATDPDQLTALDNKAAADTGNDAQLDDDISDAFAPEVTYADSGWNDLDRFRTSLSPFKRCLTVRDNSQAFTRVGTNGFRTFFVYGQGPAPDNSATGYIFQNGARDANGGGWNVQANRAGVNNSMRFEMYDASTSGRALTAVVVTSVGIYDNAPHVIMIGRSIGTGTAGVDQMVVSIDGVVPTGFPADLPASLGSLDNSGATNAATGYMFLGATAAAPALSQLQVPGKFGEFMLYRSDLTSGEETSVVNYLKTKWGVA